MVFLCSIPNFFSCEGWQSLGIRYVYIISYPFSLLYIQDNRHRYRYSRVANNTYATLRLHPQGTHVLPSTRMLLLLGSHFWHLRLTYLNNPFSHRIRLIFTCTRYLCARTNLGLTGQILASYSVRPNHFWSPKLVRPDRFPPRTKFFVTGVKPYMNPRH